MSRALSLAGICGVVFSKDRPLQLDATLRSFARHCRDVQDLQIYVLFAATTPHQQLLYARLTREHPAVSFVREEHFRSDLLRLLRDWEAVLFLVDDNIVVRDFVLADAVGALQEHQDALGFSLRLGGNTTYCYALNVPQRLPESQSAGSSFWKFRWTDAEYDFAYPLEVSSSVYRLADLRPLLEELPFQNPNTLEAALASQTARFRGSLPALLAPSLSWTFCAPVNKVQTIWQNRAGDKQDYSPDALGQRYARGERLDVAAYDGFTPIACHQEVELHLKPLQPGLPLVSVVIPCYGQARFLPEAVASVVDQTYTDWELIIVDDGSRDETQAVAQKLIAENPERSIRLVAQSNQGPASARNAGMRAATGEHLLPLDADDKLAPDFIEKTLAVLEAKPEVGFVYSHIQHFGSQNDLYRLPDFDPETIVHTDNVACVCALVRRQAWEQANGYDASMLDGYEDWDFWIRCIEHGWRGHRIPEPLFYYRKRADSMLAASRLAASNEKRERFIARIICNHPVLYSDSRRRQAEEVLAGARTAAKPRKVLLACTHFWPSVGGLETIAENLGSRLVQRGDRVDVATESRPDRLFPLYRGMRILSLDPRRRKAAALPRAAAQLRELVRSGEYDACVLLADPLNWIFWSLEGLAIPPQTHVVGQPIINADGFRQWHQNHDFRRRLVDILRRLQTIVAISTNGPEVQFLRDEQLPFVYLPNATSPTKPAADFRRRFGLPANLPLWVHVANLWPVKNHLGLLRALATLPGEWRLLMIGHPSTDAAYVRQVVAALARDDRCRWIPGLPGEEVAAAMQAADGVLLASLGEVSPVTILEAMSHGTPWLATPACGAVHDNAGGLITEVERFPAVLQQWMRQPEFRRQLGELGRQHWAACFQWERVAQAWDEVIRSGRTTVSFSMPAAVETRLHQVREEIGRAVEAAPDRAAPLVSVIVPTYNRPERLREALASILGQTLQDFEIIVVNDAGRDVRHVVASLNAEQKIRYLRHSTSQHPAAARNTGLHCARGKYIAYLDDDDIFSPEHLATLVDFLEVGSHEVAYTDAYRDHEKTVDGGHVVTHRDVPYSVDWDNDRILAANLVPILCVMHTRQASERTGGFDESLSTHEDWDFWIRLSRLYPFAHIRRVTCEFRVRDDGTSITSSQRADFLRTARIIHRNYRQYAAGKREVKKLQRKFVRGLVRKLRRSAGRRRWSWQEFWQRLTGRRPRAELALK